MSNRIWDSHGNLRHHSICDIQSPVLHHARTRWSDSPNKNIFSEIEQPWKVVIQHISEPVFRLTIGLESSETGTLVSWSQAFENSELASQIEYIVVPANEEKLDRLTAEVV